MIIKLLSRGRSCEAKINGVRWCSLLISSAFGWSEPRWSEIRTLRSLVLPVNPGNNSISVSSGQKSNYT